MDKYLDHQQKKLFFFILKKRTKKKVKSWMYRGSNAGPSV